MKTNNQMRNAESGKRKETDGFASRNGFTLIELLTVIAIIGVIAGMIFAISGPAKVRQYRSTARGEMERIEAELENYKAKYGSYPPSNPNLSALYNTLYYELSGVTHDTTKQTYTTLDGACTISETSYGNAFKTTTPAGSIGGIINCTKGGSEEGTVAKNFLLDLRANQIGASTTPSGEVITNLVTSVHADVTYRPVGLPDVNPFRYVCPGTNNPNSYDLWIQLKISGQTNLICNWNKNVVINSPMP